MMKILVTGGAGFIGSHVVESLVEAGHRVIALDDLSGGFADNVVAGASFIQGSVTDEILVNSLCEFERFDAIFHLAAYAAEGLSHFIRRFNYANNVIGSINLINAAVNHDVKSFVFTSSIAVYGAAPELPMTELTPTIPEDPYGIAKLAVEQDLKAAHAMFGLDYIIFRPHNVYGERQNIGDRYRNVVGIFMNQLLQGHPMTVFGDGSQTRAFSYIADVAPLIARSITVPAARNQTFNIGADRHYSVHELAHAVASALGTTPDINYLPARNEVQHAYSAHDKLRAVFGEQPLTSLDDGLTRMAAWVQRQGSRSSHPFEGIEVDKNFPQAWLAHDLVR
jgi:UDP-glucose 4-epimerase